MEMLPLKNWNMIIFIIKMLFIKKPNSTKEAHPLGRETPILSTIKPLGVICWRQPDFKV